MLKTTIKICNVQVFKNTHQSFKMYFHATVATERHTDRYNKESYRTYIHLLYLKKRCCEQIQLLLTDAILLGIRSRSYYLITSCNLELSRQKNAYRGHVLQQQHCTQAGQSKHRSASFPLTPEGQQTGWSRPASHLQTPEGVWCPWLLYNSSDL